MVVCRQCLFAHTDPRDDEDIYSCPFDDQECFHSEEPCHHPFSYSIALSDLRSMNNWYKWAYERYEH